MRVVLDTDVMVAALESARGASRALVVAALDGQIEMLLSTALMLEYEAVLTRAHVLDRAGVTSADVVTLLDGLADICLPVAFDFRWRPVASDPNDDMVVETAVNGVADCIASFNTKDMARGAAGFGIPVERPALVLRRIRT